MKEQKINKKQIATVVKEQQHLLQITSKYWKINKIQHQKNTFFEVTSNSHFTKMIRPINFYKPIVNLVQYE